MSALIEKLGELHPPYMNFMGPKTQVEDRMSLNYKGKDGIKRGTDNYFLPTTHSDLVSFEHDLLYWSPDNIVKSYADEKFLKDVRSIIGLIGISGQYVRRYGIEGLIGIGSVKSLISSIGSLITTYFNSKEFLNQRATLGQQRREVRQSIQTARDVIRQGYPNIASVRQLPQEERFLLNALLEKKETFDAIS